jgi:hypothetical protein
MKVASSLKKCENGSVAIKEINGSKENNQAAKSKSK